MKSFLHQPLVTVGIFYPYIVDTAVVDLSVDDLCVIPRIVYDMGVSYAVNPVGALKKLV